MIALKIKKKDDSNPSTIIHILTSHKNQALQRYIGYLHSNASFLLFLDDDMEIADKKLLRKNYTASSHKHCWHCHSFYGQTQ